MKADPSLRHSGGMQNALKENSVLTLQGLVDFTTNNK